MKETWPALQNYSALVCTSPIGVTGIIEFLKDNNISIGKDISIVGYGNCPELGSQVTSVDKSWIETGKIAVKTIMHAINNPDELVTHVKIPTNLYIGKTTGKAK